MSSSSIDLKGAMDVARQEKRKRDYDDVIALDSEDDGDDGMPHNNFSKRTSTGNGVLQKYSWQGAVKREEEERPRSMDDTQDEGEGQATTTTTSPAIHFGSRRGEDAENYDPNTRDDEDETQDEDSMKVSSQEDESEVNTPLEPEPGDKPITEALLACAKVLKDAVHQGGNPMEVLRAAPARRNLTSFFDGVLNKEQGEDEIDGLIGALANIQGQDTSRRMTTRTGKQLNHILKKVQVHVPESESSLKSVPWESTMPTSTPLAMAQALTNSSRHPEQEYSRKLDQGHELLRQYRALHDKVKKVREYAVGHKSGCKAILKEHEKLPKVYQSKVARCDFKLKEARQRLATIDQRFDDILKSKLGQGNVKVATLDIVTGVLDLIRSDNNQRLVEERKRAADALDNAIKDLKHHQAISRLVEASLVVVRVLVGKAQETLKNDLNVYEFNAHENKKGVEKELRQVVENASRDFQEVIQFHEERKRKADQNIGQRSRELREHKELFGNETPTEVKRLEECIAELKKAKSHSDGQISNCLEKNKEFDEAMADCLPPELYNKLAELFQELMKRSNVSHYYEAFTQSQVTDMDHSHKKDNHQRRQQPTNDGEGDRRYGSNSGGGGGKMPAASPPTGKEDNKSGDGCMIM